MFRRLKLAKIGSLIEANLMRFAPPHISKEIIREYGMYAPKGEIAIGRSLDYFENTNRWPVSGEELLCVALSEHVNTASEYRDKAIQKVFTDMLLWARSHSIENLPPKALEKVDAALATSCGKS
jgi:hypothetical protein